MLPSRAGAEKVLATVDDWQLYTDGRIGGFNFQWAWASGYVAGTSAFLPARDPVHSPR